MNQKIVEQYHKTTLKLEKEVILDYNGIIYPVKPNFRIKEEGEFLTVYDPQERTLVTFNLSTKSFDHEISIDFFPRQNLYSYHYHSEDSIFLGFSAAPHPQYWHDSVLLQINNKGEILKVHSTKDLPVRSSSKPELSKDLACVVAFHQGDIHYQNGQLNFLLPRYRFSPGDSLFEHHPMPIAGRMSVDDNKPNYYPIKFKTPSKIIGKGYMPRNFNFVRWTFDQKGQPLFCFGHTASIFKYNQKSNSLDSFKVGSMIMDTLNLNLYPDRYDAPQLDYAIPEYLKVYRNPYDGYYARTFRIPDTTLTGNPFDPRFNSQAEPPASMILFDDDFKQIGEFLIPEGYSIFSFFFDKGGIWLYNETKSQKLKKMVLEKFSLQHTPTTKEDFRTEVQAELERRWKNREK